MPAVALDIQFPLNAAGRLSKVVGARLRQAEYAHEMLIIDTRSSVSNDLRTNAPVHATLQDGVGQRIDFVGYVHHVRPGLAKHPGQKTEQIVCIGPTWRMNQQRQRIWQNRTASEIVLQILREYQLTANVQPTTTRFAHKAQHVSDWEFICTLAKEIGFVVYPRSTVVNFHERKHAELQQVAQSPLFTFRTTAAGYGDSDVTEFEPVLGESQPHAQGSKAARYVYGVDPRTAQVVNGFHDGRPDTTRHTDNVDALFVEAQTGVVANSVEEARLRAAGASGLAMWQHRANAETVGNVTVHPTGFVFMSEIPSHMEGFWAVISVEHRFVGNQYRLRMHLGSDSLGANVGGYKPPALPYVGGQQVARGRSKPTQAVLAQPGNFDSLSLKRSAGGPVPLQWRGSAAVARDTVAVPTKADSPAALIARARRFRSE